MSKLILNVGGMFSGKSTELQKQGKRHLYAKHNVVFVKPNYDDRYSDDEIVTHDGERVKAISVDGSLFEYPDVLQADAVLIDEIQFFPIHVFEEIVSLLNKGTMVYVSGLDKDYKGGGFVIVEKLMTLADIVNKLTSVCEVCGVDAGYTGKRTNNNSHFELGEKDLYIPLCRKCFTEHLQNNK